MCSLFFVFFLFFSIYPQAGFEPPFAGIRQIYWMKNGRISELSHHGWLVFRFVYFILDDLYRVKEVFKWANKSLLSSTVLRQLIWDLSLRLTQERIENHLSIRKYLDHNHAVFKEVLNPQFCSWFLTPLNIFTISDLLFLWWSNNPVKNGQKELI